MNLRSKALATLAVAMAVMVSMTAPAAAAGPGLNFSSDKTPNPIVVEDELVVSQHDRGDMSDPLEYYDDSGEISTLPATVNDSQTTPVGVRWDQIDAEQYRLFPRIDGESGNSANWTTTADWTTSSGSNSNVAVNDADADGVPKVTVDAGVASGETASATYADNVSITSDANKRVLMFVGNVDELTSGATVEVRAVDSDGDYRYAEINASAAAADDDVIANGTGNGFVFQERLGDLPMAGSGDGSFDGIQSVEFVTSDSDAQVTIAGLDLDKKSDFDLGEIERDTDGDGEMETTTVTDYHEGGVANLTGLDTLGEPFDSAVVNDLHVYDVQYRFADLTDESEYSTNFSSADDYSYPQKLELYADLEVPSAIDLSHGDLTLEFDQGLPTERYVTFEVASGVDSSEEFGNLSDAYSDKTGALSGQDTTATLVSSASADTTYRGHLVVLLQDEEVDTLQSDGVMGPTSSGGGGFFATIWGKVTGVVGSVLVATGLARFFGGGS
ncbi:hypothetical protein [Halomicrobium salinisoli]|uniref:hypothetical protein n=1 Tax=Halomicrobium salinisoli TaxID=2878391 RepID=UPI001CEFBDA7|nr:hypothetical protein [Halomicrobium salinisoli]